MYCTALVWSAKYFLSNNQQLTQCTELTSGAIVYPHIEAPQYSIVIRYVTAEDSCYGTLRVAVEIHSSSKTSSSSLVR